MASPIIDLDGLRYFKQKMKLLFSAHTDNAEIHVTPEEKEKWNSSGGSNVNNTTTFGSDGSITTTYTDGKSETTEFLSDGSIVTKSYKNGVLAKTETTVFNSDGTISTTYTEGGNA